MCHKYLLNKVNLHNNAERNELSWAFRSSESLVEELGFLTWGRSFYYQFSWVQSLSLVRLFATPWTAAHEASLSIANSWNLLRLMSTESMMPSIHFILCCPLLLLLSIFPSIRVFSSKSVLHIRWPNNWSFSFSISPSNEYSGLISFRINCNKSNT